MREVTTDYTSEDFEIHDIARIYERKVRESGLLKYPLFPSKLKDIRGCKNWETFRCANQIIKGINTIDKEKFIEAQIYFAKQFKRDITPSWLATKKAIVRYVDYINDRKIDSAKIESSNYQAICLENLKSSALFIEKQKLKLKLSDNMSFFKYKNDKGSIIPNSFIDILNGNLSYPFLAISKSYRKFHSELDKDIKEEFPSPNKLDNIRAYIKSNDKLNKFCKEVFREDY